MELSRRDLLKLSVAGGVGNGIPGYPGSRIEDAGSSTWSAWARSSPSWPRS